AAVYFAIAEALTNAAKHSRASEARVTVRAREDDAGRPVLWARVEDNGTGGAKVLPGGGLDGITNRVVAAGGTITIDSPAGGPTALEVNVLCASLFVKILCSYAKVWSGSWSTADMKCPPHCPIQPS